MARMPYTNFHDINLDWIIKRVMKAFTPDNPPPYPVKSVNGKTGDVLLTGGDIPFSEDFQQTTVLDFCDYALETFENMGTDIASKQDAPILAGSPGQVLGLDEDQTPVWINQPNPESIIDDNAGLGDTTKVYSADHVTGLISPIIDDIGDIEDDIRDLTTYTDNRFNVDELDAKSEPEQFLAGTENNKPSMITNVTIPYGTTVYIKIINSLLEPPIASGYAIQFRANGKFIKSLNRLQLNEWIQVELTGLLSDGETITEFGLFTNSSALTVNATFTLCVANITNKRLDVLENELSLLKNPLPDYYTEAWKNTTIKAVQAQLGNVKTGVSFAFITDMHMGYNRLQSGKLLRMLRDATPLNFVVYGGDTVNATGTKDTIDNNILAWNEFASQTGMPIYSLRGNHDFTIRTTATSETGYTYFNRFARAEVMGKFSRIVTGDRDYCYYYFDDTTNKVRYIIIDIWCKNKADDLNNNDVYWGVEDGMADDISVQQYSFLKNAFDINDYTIIPFCHSKPIIAVSSALHQFLKAFKNKQSKTMGNAGGTILYNVDFTNNTSEMPCVICGHSHIDSSETEDGVLYIRTTCDSYFANDNADRTPGTVNEQAFDVFSVDTTDKTITAYRVGGGLQATRNWNY